MSVVTASQRPVAIRGRPFHFVLPRKRNFLLPHLRLLPRRSCCSLSLPSFVSTSVPVAFSQCQTVPVVASGGTCDCATVSRRPPPTQRSVPRNHWGGGIGKRVRWEYIKQLRCRLRRAVPSGSRSVSVIKDGSSHFNGCLTAMNPAPSVHRVCLVQQT